MDYRSLLKSGLMSNDLSKVRDGRMTAQEFVRKFDLEEEFNNFVKEEFKKRVYTTCHIDGKEVKVLNFKESDEARSVLEKIKTDVPVIRCSTKRLDFIMKWFKKSYDLEYFQSPENFEHLPFPACEVVFEDDEADIDIILYSSDIDSNPSKNSTDTKVIEFLQVINNKYGRLGSYNLMNGKFGMLDTSDIDYAAFMKLTLILIVFIRDYAEVIHHRDVTEHSVRVTNNHGKIKRHKTSIIRKVYEINDDTVTYVKTHHRYTKPTEEFGVRGHYRTYKSGKKVWVNGFKKYSDSDKTIKQEYVV